MKNVRSTTANRRRCQGSFFVEALAFVDLLLWGESFFSNHILLSIYNDWKTLLSLNQQESSPLKFSGRNNVTQVSSDPFTIYLSEEGVYIETLEIFSLSSVFVTHSCL